MPYFEHDGLLFYYAVTGQGTPFVFQHGLGGSLDQIVKFYSPPLGVELVTFDFRAHGKTPPDEQGKLNFKTFADDLLAFINHLGLNKVIVGGISMGAAVALNFTLRYTARVMGLILLRPAWLDGPMEHENRELFRTVARLIRDYGPEAGRRIFLNSEAYRQLSTTSPATAQSFLGQFDYEHASETAAKLECLPADQPSDDRSEWKRITMPALIMANKSDPVHPFEYGLEYAAAIAQAEFKELTPKSINEEQHNKEVRENINAFIRYQVSGIRYQEE